MAEGQGLDQVKQELLEEGYEKEVVDFATGYVAREQRVSKTDKARKGPKTKEEHLTKRFLMPILYIAVLVAAILIIVSLLGEEEAEVPEEIDIFLYDSLGIRPENYDIITTEEIYSRPEFVDTQLAKAILENNKAEPMMEGLETTETVKGFQKTVTVYGIKKKGGSISQRTLVKIRFSAEEDTDKLIILESIPKSAVGEGELLLPEGGILAVKDPVIKWTFQDVSKGQGITASYVIKKEVKELDTVTFPAREKVTIQAGPAVCGDGKCTPGENYVSCCSDCGCPQGFKCNGIQCVSAEEHECNTDKDCDDGIKATIDKCEGKPRICTNFYTRQCTDDDDYCPVGCNHTTDNDCPEPVNETETVEERNWTINTAPKITAIAVSPPFPAPGDTITIEAQIEDPNGPEDLVMVWCGIIELVDMYDNAESQMLDDGSEDSGDSEADDGMYTARILLNSTVAKAEYTAHIYVRDTTGNEVTAMKKFEVD